MATKIARWGNSYAVRVPKAIMDRSGLKQGDDVDFFINTTGNLELFPIKETHRHIKPTRKIHAEELLKAYRGERLANQDSWPDEGFVGAEQKAWQS